MATSVLEPRVTPGRSLRQIDLGIWSALTGDYAGAPYDTRAMAYDLVVGNPHYQRILWGVSTDTFEAFTHEAFTKDNQPFLDAGCGTMRFTAPVYAGVELPIHAVDLSLGMLKKARDRLGSIVSDAPNRAAFVQADLLDLPFPMDSYETVLSMGTLHLFEDCDELLRSLARMLRPGGELYLTSLVSVDRPLGEKYGAFLLGRGEIKAWRHPDEVKSAIDRHLDLVSFWTEGNMAFAWAVKPL